MDTCVIIPTYNAKTTITKVIKEVLQFVPNAIILVIDDNSPDKTADIVKNYFSKEKRVKLIVRRKKGGRGSAVIAGFKETLRDENIKFLVEMDADLCHDPKYIPIMIEKAKRYDVVIASKYLKGSKIIGLPLKRIIFSKIVNFFIKLMLRVPITDYTNGFRCYRKEVLEKIDFNAIQSKGFIVLSEIAYAIHRKHFRFGEIPFIFKFEEKNPSNLNFYEIKEAFFTILRLKQH